MEMVRVNYNHGNPDRVPGNRLQSKGKIHLPLGERICSRVVGQSTLIKRKVKAKLKGEKVLIIG